MANRSSPQSLPLRDEVPNQMRIGIEILLDPKMPEPELTPSTVAGNDGFHKFLGLFTEFTWKLRKSGLTWPNLTWAVLVSLLENQKLHRISVISF